MNKLTVSVIAGAGLCAGFLAYCVYFDRKRRSDPNFKSKLRERRMKEESEQLSKKQNSNSYPDLSDASGLEKFFINEMQLGQQLLSNGDIDNGTEHVAFAVLVSPNKEELMGFLSMQLPDDIFQMVIQKIPLCGEKLIKNAKLMSDTLMPTDNGFKFDLMNEQELVYEIDEDDFGEME